jgi:hypothetical protein
MSKNKLYNAIFAWKNSLIKRQSLTATIISAFNAFKSGLKLKILALIASRNLRKFISGKLKREKEG